MTNIINEPVQGNDSLGEEIDLGKIPVVKCNNCGEGMMAFPFEAVVTIGAVDLKVVWLRCSECKELYISSIYTNKEQRRAEEVQAVANSLRGATSNKMAKKYRKRIGELRGLIIKADSENRKLYETKVREIITTELQKW